MKKIGHILPVLAALLFFSAVQAQEQAQSSSFYKVKLGRVIDGDTFKVYLACTYKLFCSSVSVRVRGIDTPELRSKDEAVKQKAREARAFTKAFLESGKIRLKDCTKDKYFRLLCDVSVDGESLASALLEAGLAKEYDGGEK